MTQNEFKLKQQAAIERMREINSQSKFKNENPQKTPTQQPKNSDNQKHYNNCSNTQESILSKNIFDIFSKDGDTALIIGLLLILMSEKSDKMLLFALIYILT